MLTVISLGAGVQSTTMALMAAHGEIAANSICSATNARACAVFNRASCSWSE